MQVRDEDFYSQFDLIFSLGGCGSAFLIIGKQLKTRCRYLDLLLRISIVAFDAEPV